MIRNYHDLSGQPEHDNAYTTELEAAGVRDILRLAIAFRGKEFCLKTREEHDRRP